MDFSSIAKSCGYGNVYIAESLEEFELHIKAFLNAGHSVLSEAYGSSEKSLQSFMSNKLPCDFSHNPQASSQSLECQDSNDMESRANSSNTDSKAEVSLGNFESCEALCAETSQNGCRTNKKQISLKSVKETMPITTAWC